MSTIDSLLQLLQCTKVLLCVNMFGNVYVPEVGPLPPSDEELIDLLVAVKRSPGGSDVIKRRVIISMNICSKIQQSRCGGKTKKIGIF